MRASRPSLLPYLICAGVLQVVWGLVPSASNLVISQIPVEIYIALRWSISGLVFLIWVLLTQGAASLFKRSTPHVALLGLLGYGFGSLGTLYGLKLGGVVNFALVSTISPLFTTAMSILVLKESPSRIFAITLPLSIAGSVLIVMGKHALSSWSIALGSMALIAGAYLLEALVFVFSKRLKESHSRIGYLAIAQTSAALGMWAAQGVWFHQTDQLTNLDAHGWSAAIFVSVVACVLCFYVLHWLVLHVPGHKLSLFEGLHGLSATAFGMLLFGESWNAPMMAGGALILIALVLDCLPKRESD
jgi:drug/metabolite transporter (DMT)-like permease